MLAGALALSLLGVAGCADDEPEASDPTPSASSSAAAPDSSSATATGSPSSSTSPGVAPAAGPELALDVASVHAPEGWELLDSVSASTVSAGGRGGRVQLIELEGASDLGLDATADAFLQGQPDGATTERLEDVPLGEDGTPALHFAWTIKGDDTRYEAVMTVRAGTSVAVYVDAAPSLLEREPDLVASVLASLTWLR